MDAAQLLFELTELSSPERDSRLDAAQQRLTERIRALLLDDVDPDLPSDTGTAEGGGLVRQPEDAT
jgi:hypothetical protein